MLRDLLEYSKVEVGARPQHTIAAEEALNLALTNLQVTIEESCAIVTSDPLPATTSYTTQLVQIFQNLIGNAIKYRSAATPQIHVSTKGDGEERVFSVQDNGLGIAPQHFEKIFVLFQRLHGPTELSGTGIGLATCKKIVERQGGRIWVESVPEKGSTFYFSLPELEVK
jgi:light-regulated signal transduction histidine kinase (bacteriophytochrome)